MTTQEVANEVTKLCREGKWEEIYERFFATDIKSIEPEGSPLGSVVGLEAIMEKGKQWEAMIEEFHSSEISDPIVADNFFALTMKSNVTFKGQSEPMDTDEVCVYNVRDGKIISEQFFYTPLAETV